MANPTAQVAMSFGSYLEGNDARYWPLNTANNADTYYTGEMIGMNPQTGYAGHLDDTQAWVYLGNKIGDTHRLQTDTPTFDFKEQIRWTRFIDMPINSGTPALPTNFGDPAYATDSGHVQVTASTNNNLIGMVVDIGRYASTGPGLSGGIVSLTGSGSPLAVRVACVQPGALLGLLVQGIPGPGTAGGAAKTLTVNGGAGANSTATTGTTAGGAGSNFNLTLGAGGAASSTGAAAGGAGGIVNLTAGAGGNAAGTSAAGAGGGLALTLGAGGNNTKASGGGNGGAGGSLVVTCGAGGTSTSGSAGAPGNVQLTAGTDPAAGTPTLQLLVTDTPTAGVTDGFTGALKLTPTIAGAQTVTRHNYIDVNNVAGAATVTDACVLRFNAAAGTHKAVDAGTTKTSPGTVTQWIKVNINGTLAYIPSYSSKTS